jgi:hypothetical protein
VASKPYVLRKEPQDRSKAITVKRHIKRNTNRALQVPKWVAVPATPPVAMESTMVTARIPAHHFASIPHEGRCHYSLANFQDINRAGYELFLAIQQYPRARLAQCDCGHGLILVID